MKQAACLLEIVPASAGGVAALKNVGTVDVRPGGLYA
jgi:hypothetical protein